jgi:prepilin-type N-terminal cleavage/methylation domain-containing protein
MVQKQTGFTLIEIAIVLVIIGLLLGGVLKGQELITSARVRNLISQQDGVKAAFFGFQDRFRAFPGDYSGATANISAISTAACNGGNGDGDGRIESGDEARLAWEHMSKAGFIAGSYTCAAADSATTTPVNPYGLYLQVIYDGAYGGGSSPQRHNVKTGPQIPVELIPGHGTDGRLDNGASVHQCDDRHRHLECDQRKHQLWRCEPALITFGKSISSSRRTEQT